jgi:two-component system, LytTR family, response regulator
VADLRCAVIDDEPPARRRIRDLLARESGVSVVAEAGNGTEAVRVIDATKPDLVFLDVQMPGGDGFEVLGALESPPPAVIFVTAFDAYALRAFEVHALDYLLKPFDRDRFQAALVRARKQVQQHPSGDDPRMLALLQELAGRDNRLRRVAVRTRGHIKVVSLDDVECIEASGNYLRLHVTGGHYLLRETISGFEARLDPEQFVRIHRSMIVNVARIRDLAPTSHGDCRVTLTSGREVPLSRSYRCQLKERLGPDL